MLTKEEDTWSDLMTTVTVGIGGGEGEIYLLKVAVSPFAGLGRACAPSLSSPWLSQ